MNPSAPELAQRIADCMDRNEPFPSLDSQKLLDLARRGLEETDAVEIVNVLQSAIRACDWEAYVQQHRLSQVGLVGHCIHDVESDDLADREVRRDLAAALVERDDESQRTVEKPEIAGKTLDEIWEARESHQSIERFLTEVIEDGFQADHAAVNDIVLAVNTASPSHLRQLLSHDGQLYWKLLSNLPRCKGDACQAVAVPSFLHDLLTVIGAESRHRDEIVRACGHELFILFPFPREIDPQLGTYRFRQARFLLDAYGAANPNDWEALAWRAELAARAKDLVAAESLAARLWDESSHMNSKAIARFILFSYGRSFDNTHYDCEPTFGGVPYTDERIGEVSSHWYDRDEAFADALLRREFVENRWSVDTLRALQEMTSEGIGNWQLPNVGPDEWYVPEEWMDVLPAAAWIHLAGETEPAEKGYIRYWKRALSSAYAASDWHSALLAIPFVAAGVIRADGTGEFQKQAGLWLDVIDKATNTLNLRTAAASVTQGFSGAVNWLATTDRVILARLERQLAAEIAKLPRGKSDDLPILVNHDIRATIAHKEPDAKVLLGPDLWTLLLPDSRQHICEYLGLFEEYQQIPGDNRSYSTPIRALEIVITNEVEAQFSKAIGVSFFFDCGEEGKGKSLGSFLFLLNCLRSPSKTSHDLDRTAILKSRINLDMLCTHEPAIKEFNKLRNRATHVESIKLEDANLFHSKWIRHGLLKRFLDALHPRK